jgi:uncharacterized membrane-anchored protein
MTTRQARVMIVIASLLVLGAVNYAIYGKERTIAAGKEIFLELAPVDPRSLLQGDYMALRFRLAEEIAAARTSGAMSNRIRLAPLRIDERGVATLHTSDTGGPALRFKIRNGAVWLGTNAYFFEEGAARRFESARYGEFRLDPESGEAVLVGLRDEDLRKL